MAMLILLSMMFGYYKGMEDGAYFCNHMEVGNDKTQDAYSRQQTGYRAEPN